MVSILFSILRFLKTASQEELNKAEHDQLPARKVKVQGCSGFRVIGFRVQGLEGFRVYGPPDPHIPHIVSTSGDYRGVETFRVEDVDVRGLGLRGLGFRV